MQSEVSEQDYKRLEEARRQHEDELKARRELRAARRKASQAKAAAERAAASAGASVATSATVTRERTLSGVTPRLSEEDLAVCLVFSSVPSCWGYVLDHDILLLLAASDVM